ncbi:tRNA dimethylallyltransferase [Diachasma alloeum]|uniref:tRNA dimethylallyltransferase n=1 Tax=Diachasma alloeum TaxID=454923 RepID=UPI0007383F9F|nr:tRNA dimethylallyltransferase [Diachasma alloeum]
MVDSGAFDMSRVPILVILGSTGTGKSRLGIELAQKFAGEIISADSMQVYKGLDIITAKVTKEEKEMVPHHMLDVVDPLFNYCVVDYKKKALPIMNDLVSRRKMPIIVGGTNYYIESLLWQILVEDPEASGNTMRHDDGHFVDREKRECENEVDDSNKGKIITQSAEEPPDKDERVNNTYTCHKKMKFDDSIETNEALHRRLTKIDPEMARRLHPNNRRKVIRSLEVFENHGITLSDILKAQRSAGGSGLGGPLRFPNSLILWLRCDQKILDERLDKRVDAMLHAGLVEELLDFHERYNKQWIERNSSPDYTKGIFQSIGFKEFHNYLILPEDERNSEKGQALLKQGIEDLKLVTRRYARRQQRWTMNRFIRRTDRQVPPVYELDCTNIDEWDTKVLKPAIEIVDAKLRGEKPAQKPINENIENEKCTDSSNEEAHWCEICEKVLIGELQWRGHKNGAKHKKMMEKKKILIEAALDQTTIPPIF